MSLSPEERFTRRCMRDDLLRIAADLHYSTDPGAYSEVALDAFNEAANLAIMRRRLDI